MKRAVERVYEQIGKMEKPIYTYGPIIHNEQVVGDLQEKGVEVIDTLEELKTIRDAVVVIRSHGVGKDVYDILKENGVEIRRRHMSVCKKDPPDRGKTDRRRKKSSDRRQ